MFKFGFSKGASISRNPLAEIFTKGFSTQIRSKGASISRNSLAEILPKGFSTQIERKLEGKVALITGAANGVGKATATKFINNGAKVIIADIQHQLGQDTAKELGPNVAFIACDVTKESDISNAVDFAISKFNQLDIMYNNAGVHCNSSPSIADLDLALFDRVMSINARGVMAGIKHASRVMIPRRTGSILCTASITGIMAGVSQHSYAVSKATVIGIVKTVASELCKYGIRVNSISPFIMPTPFIKEAMNQLYPVYLASEDAKYVNGHNLVVDGGFTSFKSLGFPAPDQV